MNRSNGMSGRFPAVLSALVVLLAGAMAPGQTVWYIDDDAIGDPGPGDVGISDPSEDGSAAHPFDAIQEAINASTNGDQLLVADGTYTGPNNRNLDFLGKAIALSSISDNPDQCVIDCQSNGFGMIFQNNEGPDTTVQGITITRGYSAPNAPNNYAGGISCIDSSPTITNCKIVFNSVADWTCGVGITCVRSNSIFRDCLIHGNSSHGTTNGGGIFSLGGAPQLINCTITENSASRSGGGVWHVGAALRITGCTILDNDTSGLGGGISCLAFGSIEIADSLIEGNHATGYGGGILTYGTSTTIVNSIIRNNSTESQGGGLYCGSDSLSVTNCTFTGNTATTDGGAIYNNAWDANIANTIFWNNSPHEIDGDYTTPAVSYCNVQGGFPGIGNIDADPLFIQPDNLHLSAGSPCIDAGTNTPPNGLPDTDIEGTLRPLDGDSDFIPIADMGAYEFDPDIQSILTVPNSLEFIVTLGAANSPHHYLAVASTYSSPLTWQISYKPDWLIVDPIAGTLLDDWQYLDLSINVDRLNPGNYDGILTIESSLDGDISVDVPISLHVTDSQCVVPWHYPTIQEAIDAAQSGDIIEVLDGVYTGPGNTELDFQGKAITLRSASRNPALCIIDCGGTTSGVHFTNGEDSSTVLDGFTITRGNAEYGAAIYCQNSSPTITNCIITKSAASEHGGGVYCKNAQPAISHCTITENLSESGGAGIYCENSNPDILNCTIAGNIARYSGAGLQCEDSNPRVTNCLFTGNSTGAGGGALRNLGHSVPTLTNCTIVHNLSGDNGAGIFCQSYTDPTIVNCIIWGNRPDAPSEYEQVSSREPLISFSRIQNWSGTYGGLGNSGDAPLFFDADGPDNDPYTWQDNDYRLIPGSSCIDAGSNGALPNDDSDIDDDGITAEPLPIDLDGRPRVIDHPQTDPTGVPTPPDLDSVVDIGAYEFNDDQPHITVNRQSFTFFATATMHNPQQQILTIRNSGGESLEWQLSDQPSWLTPSPTTGQTESESDHIILTPDITNLSPGTYTASIVVADPQADNSPLIVPIVAHVGTARYVPDDYATIQNAIDEAGRGDTIILADGTYTGDGNKNLDFRGKEITVRGSANNPTRCVIDCENDGRAFYFHSNEGRSSVIAGLAMINGYVRGDASPRYYGAAVFCYRGSPTILNCILANNSATYGGALTCARASGPAITNCLINNNSASSTGGALYSDYGNPIFTNCTITNNSGRYTGGIAFSNSSAPDPTLVNTVVWNNTPRDMSTNDSISVSHSNIRGGWDGPGNIDADPLFIDPDGPDDDPDTWQDNDYRLSPGSACIDAGSNGALPYDNLDLDGNGITDELIPIDIASLNRLFDDPGTIDAGVPLLPLYPNVVDIGAHEFNGTSIPGDLTGDGTVDEADFAVFLAAFGHSSQDSQYNYYCDYDHDGFITFADYQIWLQRYRDFVGNLSAPAPTGQPADFDADNDVDLKDFAVMQTCVPSTPATNFPCTLKFDLNDDGQVNAQDLAEFRTILLGP